MHRNLRARRRIIVTMNMSIFAGKRKLDGIIDFLGPSRKWELLLLRADKDFSSRTLIKAIEYGIDGLILLNFPSSALIRKVYDSGIPAVIESCNTAPTGINVPVTSICLDVHELMRQAIEHFWNQRIFRSYGFVRATGKNGWSEEREKCFSSLLKEKDIDCSTCSADLNQLISWLRNLEKPAAILSANDETAQIVLATAKALKLRIPEELALLGIDNNPKLCNDCNLDSIAIDFEQAGKLAAAALEGLMDGTRTAPSQILYGTRGIVVRGSSLSPNPAFNIVRNGITFIDANIRKGISVENVVQHLGISRRLADLRFHETIGRTILDCIQQRRIEEVKRLLRETELPISALARKIGIVNTNHLKNIFRREVGQSMRNYRNSSHKHL